MRTKVFLWLKKLYLWLKPLPVVGAIVGWFVGPVEKWLGPKRKNLFPRDIDLEKSIERSCAAAIGGLSRKIDEQNAKIENLEKEMITLQYQNRYILLYAETVKEKTSTESIEAPF